MLRYLLVLISLLPSVLFAQQLTDSQLATQLNTLIPNNTSNAITPANVRKVTQDGYDARISIYGNLGIKGLLGYNTLFTLTNDKQLVHKKYVDDKFAAIASSVLSFNGRTGTVLPQAGDYTFDLIGSKPTSISGYGIIPTFADFAAFYYPLTGNPSNFITLVQARAGFSAPGPFFNYNSITGVLGTSYTPLSNVLAEGKIFIGNSSGVATERTPSGDVGLSATGVFTLPSVNSNIGTFNNITINAKGQAIAGANILYELQSNKNATGTMGNSSVQYPTEATIRNYINALAYVNQAGARAAISSSSSFTLYNQTTGVISNTYTPEDPANKASDMSVINSTKYPTTALLKSQLDLKQNSISVSSGKALGRYSAGTGTYQELSFGSGINLNPTTGEITVNVPIQDTMIVSSPLYFREGTPTILYAEDGVTVLTDEDGDTLFAENASTGRKLGIRKAYAGGDGYMSKEYAAKLDTLGGLTEEVDPLAVKLATVYPDPAFVGTLSWGKIVGAPTIVTSITGTTNQITIAGTSTSPVVQISATYPGQSSINTVGNLTSGSLGAGFTPVVDARIASAVTWNAKEPGLGNPPVNGYILSSTSLGVRSWVAPSTTTVTGTTNQITVTGTTSNPVIGISATYAGQTSLNTLGNITTGTWQGTPISNTYISSAATWNAKEPGLGNPASNGYILSSTSLGVRSWIPIPSSPVTSVFGRTGAITALSTDYSSFYYSISNPSNFITLAQARAGASSSGTFIAYNPTTGVISSNWTPENVVNKTTTLTSPDNTKYPTTLLLFDQLALKENASNKNATGTMGNSTVQFPTESTIRNYISSLSYVTQAGARSSISSTSAFVGYNSATGVISTPYTPENNANKATTLSSPDNVKYPTTLLLSDQLGLKQNVISLSQGTIMGRWTGAGTGAFQQITLGANLTLNSSGVLSATGVLTGETDPYSIPLTGTTTPVTGDVKFSNNVAIQSNTTAGNKIIVASPSHANGVSIASPNIVDITTGNPSGTYSNISTSSSTINSNLSSGEILALTPGEIQLSMGTTDYLFKQDYISINNNTLSHPAGSFDWMLPNKTGTIALRTDTIPATQVSGLPTPLTPPFSDATALVKNSTDATKTISFATTFVPTGTNRVLTAPQQNGTIALTNNAAFDQNWFGVNNFNVTTRYYSTVEFQLANTSFNGRGPKFIPTSINPLAAFNIAPTVEPATISLFDNDFWFQLSGTGGKKRLKTRTSTGVHEEFAYLSDITGGGSGITSFDPVGSSPSVNGATVSGTTATLQPASASFPGVVSTTTQSIAGAKTFTSPLRVPLRGASSGTPSLILGTANDDFSMWVDGPGDHSGSENLKIKSGAASDAYVIFSGKNISAETINLVNVVTQNTRTLTFTPNTTSKTSNYTVTDSEMVVLVDATSGPVTITIPSLYAGGNLIIKKIDATANAVIIDPEGSDLVEFAATQSMTTQGQAYNIVRSSSNSWYKIN
jgi:hypothetical protein